MFTSLSNAYGFDHLHQLVYCHLIHVKYIDNPTKIYPRYVGIGQVRLRSLVRNYFSVLTILNSTGCCK